jgi:peroxiredoxin
VTGFLPLISGLVALLLFVAPHPADAILQKGQAAPPINVTTLSGQQVTLANYRGHVLIMDFFATWCIPCKESISHLVNLNRKFGRQGLQVLGMSIDEGADKEVKVFAAENRITYPVAVAGDDLQTSYGLRSVPTVYVINKKGVVAEKFQGFNNEIEKKIEALITRLLAE